MKRARSAWRRRQEPTIGEWLMVLLLWASSVATGCEASSDSDGPHTQQVPTTLNNQESNFDELDDRTLLDVFGQVSKEYLTQNVIPPTDALCRWDWRVASCEPHCECLLQFQWGDYHLGRSCRLRRRPNDMEEPMVEDSVATCDSSVLSSPSSPAHETYMQIMQHLWSASQQIQQRTQRTARTVQESSRARFAQWKQTVCEELLEKERECVWMDEDEQQQHEEAVQISDDDASLSGRNWKQQWLCRHIPPAPPCSQRKSRDGSSAEEDESVVASERTAPAVNSIRADNQTIPTPTTKSDAAGLPEA